MLSDYHMHTNFSLDSTFEMEDEIKTAIKRGLNEICFTEHVDHVGNDDADLDAYRKEFERCKQRYKNEITLKRGVEFGMQQHTVREFKQDFDKEDFDFVILSCHQIENLGLWNQEFQEGKTQQEINERYYNEILECIKHYHDYSVLGHLDAIKRDDPYGEYDDEKVMDLIKEILQIVIRENKGIEINTSNDRYGLSDSTPSRKILTLYYELGGKILTIGSDSHKEEHVGYKIVEAKKMAKEIGFTHFCTFEKMKPIFHEL